ncbi:MAG: hypothetical protein ACXW2P_06070 [Thermoanaerobaculia bacterium]
MTGRPRSNVHRWVRRFFLVWAIGSTLWVANSMRTRGVMNLSSNFDDVWSKRTSH